MRKAVEGGRLPLRMESVKIIVRSLGWPGTWGKGDTIAEARQAARNPKHYEVFIAPAETTCSADDGGFIGDRQAWPRRIDAVLPRPKRARKPRATSRAM
jgi:hypothetical protein